MAKLKEEWLIKDQLCDWGGQVRIERGPQVLELDCTEENLRDEVTEPGYRLGGRDAQGRLILPADYEEDPHLAYAAHMDRRKGIMPVVLGEKMKCVDWKARMAPYVWNVYQLCRFVETDVEGNEVEKERFVKVTQVEGLDEAKAEAGKLLKEMGEGK